MSLLKAKDLKLRTKGYEDLQQNFVDIVDMCESYTTPDLIALIQIYSTYSCEYLHEIATTLKQPKGIKETMTYMNSYIAELCHATGNKYFNAEQGYSIIDKTVQTALDNEGVVTYEEVNEIIEAINASYMEEEIPEEE